MNDGGGDYERALGAPVFRAAFEAAYRGDVDPLDALWWREHPGAPSPSGVADPDAGLAALRRSLYAPDADDGVRTAYERARAAAASRRAATEAAVRDAEAAIAPRDVEAPEPLTPPVVPKRRRTKRLILVVAVVTVIALSATIAGIAAHGSPAAAPSPGETFAASCASCTGQLLQEHEDAVQHWLVGRGAGEISLDPPATAGVTLATAIGTTSGERSPDLNAGGDGIIFGLRCVGVGAVDVKTTDGTTFHYTCSSPTVGTTEEHRDYGSHRAFAFSVTITGVVTWAFRVASIDRD